MSSPLGEGIQGLNKSQGDLLTAAELWNLLQNTKKIGQRDKKGVPRKGHRHGPASVLAGALELVGWEIVEPCIWKNREGDEMNISKVSTAMLVKFLCKDWETKQWEEAELKISRDQQLPVEGLGD